MPSDVTRKQRLTRAATLLLAFVLNPAAAVTISNTATVAYDAGTVPGSVTSNTVTLETLPAPAPAVVEFLRYAPGTPGSTVIAADGGSCQNGAGTFVATLPVTDSSGTVIDTSVAAVLNAASFQTDEAVFIRLTDANRNLDPAARDFIDLRITTSSGDEEVLRLQETGIDTGVFATAVQGLAMPPAATRFDCRLSVMRGTTLQADYADIFFPADVAQALALVDPFGVVFDSATGLPVDGATVTLIDVATGSPATVFGVDGTSAYPATVTSGAPVTDASGRLYTPPPGGFQFPWVAPGQYLIQVTPPDEFVAPSTLPLAVLQTVLDPAGSPYAVGPGSLGGVFDLLVGPAFRVDIPVDPLQSRLLLQKQASTTDVSAGDFLQYRLMLQNGNAAGAINNIEVSDTLPPGLRYQAGSLRIAGLSAPDPAVSADGRSLTIAAGALAAGAQLEITYVVEVSAGARVGSAVNRAIARAGGGLESNAAEAAVRVRKPFFTAGFTVIGRVVDGECGTSWRDLKGVGGVRLLLDDGTYVATDRDGQYHFEGLRPGTHVVQLDLDSLPPQFEAIPCIQNTRFGGRSFSQFVEGQGGSLWRADFYVRRRGGDVGIRLGSALAGAFPGPGTGPGRTVAFRVVADGGQVPIRNLVATVQLPASVNYVPGSTRVDGAVTADPEVNAGFAVFRLGDVGADWQRVVEFQGRIADKPSLSGTQKITLRAQFDSGLASLRPEGVADAEDLIEQLRGTRVTRVSVVGHTDSQRLSPARRELYEDNYALSLARAQTVAQALMQGLGLSADQVSIAGKGPDEPLAGNDTAAGMANNRRVEVSVFREEAPSLVPATCPASGLVSKAVASFDTRETSGLRTPAVDSQLSCGTAATSAVDPNQTAPGPDAADDGLSSRETVAVKSAGETSDADLNYERVMRKRRAIADDTTAAGGDLDWLAGQEPGTAWLFPSVGDNPRAPTQRVVIKHAPGQRIVLKSAGQTVDPLSFDGMAANAAGTVAVSVWRGLPLTDGDNRFDAEVVDGDGKTVATLTRIVHYANAPVSAELVPEESFLVADGLRKPIIAVRFLDRDGRPVRAGVTGPLRINPPYVAAQEVEMQQRRQLAGIDRYSPTFKVEGEDGVAYIELAPTAESGSVVINLSFQLSDRRSRNQELRAWLTAQQREWVVVGFAAGTVGYDTVDENLQALAGQGGDDGTYNDGQLSLYAKGRVLGKWLLTLAYDSDKPTHGNRPGLLSTIDPNEFYTVYGDGAEQRYDAASARKLYVKLEREQFYALFGDFETGLTQTQLSRYSRALTGVKGELNGSTATFTGFASETGQHFARDEIQGNGTSGLYRLTRGGIVINGERIRLETRDRFRSEVIVESRQLLRHIDYDIDYEAGTLFFRTQVNSRDFNFNPVFIVAEYETFGVASDELTAGGRLGSTFLDGRLKLGVSYISDETGGNDANLGGVDARIKLASDTELRIEGARSEARNATTDLDGSAWLAEIEHHSGSLDVLAYARRQAPGFGLGQQNAAEGATHKTGVDAQWRLSERVAIQGQAQQQENLVTGATREYANARLAFRADGWGMHAGAQFAHDETLTGDQAESQQATWGVTRSFLDRKLEFTAQGDMSLGSNNASLDFPDRYQVGAAYAISDDVRLLAVQEITDGEALDTSTTRLGMEMAPWKGARLSSTLNQNDISEYGPRTFALLGLTQSFLAGERWGFDVSADASRTLDESGQLPPVINENHPIASGGVLGSGALTEDFVAVSAGATYRSELWSWTGRMETRDGDMSDRRGFTSGFLRQAQAGVAFAASAQAFQVARPSGATGLLANLSLSWAYRPLGRRWSVLDRLEYRHDELTDGMGVAADDSLGANALAVVGDAKSRRFVNNLVLNRVSREWNAEDRRGNLFELNQRNQWSLYYGSKYVFDQFDGVDYSGYTDILGLEWRHDVTRRIDLGFRASLLHAWNADNYEYSGGPVVGFSPFDNAWISLGYNVRGFRDRDFESAHYTAQGPYLTVRFKFDQSTRIGGRDRAPARARTPDEMLPDRATATGAGQ